MIGYHTKLAIVALVNVDEGATEDEREMVRRALEGVRPQGRTVRPREAARLLGVHRNTVMNWIRSGKLQPVRGATGKVVGVTEASLAKA